MTILVAVNGVIQPHTYRPQPQLPHVTASRKFAASSISGARQPRVATCNIVMCSSGGDESEEQSSMDWDRAWQRWQLEGLADQPQQASGSGSEAMQDALAGMLSAEAAREAAKQELEAAARQKAELEAELEELQQSRAKRLPWQFEELDALRIIFEKGSGLNIGLRLVAFALLLSLLFRWRTRGFEDMLGCVAMPLVCAANDIMGR